MLLFNLLLAQVVIAQTNDLNPMMEKFVTHYNAGEYEKIHSIFSDKLQEKMTLVELEGLFQGLKAGVGKIVEFEFVATDSESFFHYKTSFEQTVLDVSFLTERLSTV